MAELRRFNSALVRTDKTTATATTRTSQLGKATRTAGSKLRSAAGYAAGAAAAYLSISQAKAAVETTQNLAQASASLSTNLGLNVKQASRWASVAKTRDISTKALNELHHPLDDQAGHAMHEGAGHGEAMEPFTRARDHARAGSAEGWRQLQQTLPTVADAFGDAEGGAKRQAAAPRCSVAATGRCCRCRQGANALREQLVWATNTARRWARRRSRLRWIS